MATVQGVPALPLPGERSAEEKHLPSDQKPEVAEDKTGDAPPSRFSLRMNAGWWRSLQCIGMGLHSMAPPRPPAPNFVKTIPSTFGEKQGDFDLQFYLPRGYTKDKQSKQWPVVVNFHGGGFTLGKATDDGRFARCVLEKANAVFVSVGYRLAPEFPFPTAVDDGADALRYIILNADQFRIDRNRMATSGFSAGGNIALTAPMRLKRHIESKTMDPALPDYKILAVATWYPITDYTLSRDERRAYSARPEYTLSPALTNLFDASYLFPPNLDLSDPTLSPNKASDEELMESIPPNVFFFTCEWDMLLREGEELARRLQQEPVSKRLFYTMINEVPHGWDKAPNPIKPPAKSQRLYAECCRRLRRVFDGAEPRLIFERPRRVPPLPTPP
ncbi:alpha/beta-hydrolase [Xylariomycetidae sp. FL0641]|nr:alpha/beta-hydrolase [Xylariomycetidae sp. FL0641]